MQEIESTVLSRREFADRSFLLLEGLQEIGCRKHRAGRKFAGRSLVLREKVSPMFARKFRVFSRVENGGNFFFAKILF